MLSPRKRRTIPTLVLSVLSVGLTFVLSMRSICRTETNLLQPTAVKIKIHASQRVAVCIAGNARTFRYNFVHASLLKHIIHPLRRTYATDVFFILRADDDGARNRTLSAIPDMRATLRAANKFNPVNLTMITIHDEFDTLRYVPRSSHAYDLIKRPSRCTEGTQRNVRLPHALFRAKQCLQTIRMYEQKQRIQYDWVYRLRPDMLLFDRVLLPLQLRADTLYTNQGRTGMTNDMGKWWKQARRVMKAGYGAIADQMSISSRHVAEVALRAFDAVDDCELYKAHGQHLPEGIYRFWLLKQNIKYKAVPFDWATVREHIGPECYRLYFQVGVGTNWTQSMERCYRFARSVQHHFPKMKNSTLLIDELSKLTRPKADITAI